MNIAYMPLAKLTTPRDGECRVRHWWVVHPEHGAVFYVFRGGNRVPQCNINKRIDELRARIYPDCKLMQIEVAYLGSYQWSSPTASSSTFSPSPSSGGCGSCASGAKMKCRLCQSDFSIGLISDDGEPFCNDKCEGKWLERGGEYGEGYRAALDIILTVVDGLKKLDERNGIDTSRMRRLSNRIINLMNKSLTMGLRLR